MTLNEWVSIAALVVALGVGIAHFILQKRVAADQHSIQSRLAFIEEERRSEELASRSSGLVECRKEKRLTTRGSATTLIFKNVGQDDALEVWFDPEPLSQLIPSNVRHEFPALAPGQEWTVLADPTMTSPEQVTFTYGWTDQRGTHERRYVLDVFG